MEHASDLVSAVVLGWILILRDIIRNHPTVLPVAIFLVAVVAIKLVIAKLKDATAEATANEALRQANSNASLATAHTEEEVGLCPNCGVELPFSAAECRGCKATFGVGSAWQVQPKRRDPSAA